MPCTLRFPMPPPGRHGALHLPSPCLPNGTVPTNHAGRHSSFLRPPNRSFATNRKRHIFVIAFLQNRPFILSLSGRKAVRKCHFVVEFVTCFLFVNMSSIICKHVIGIGEAFEEVEEPPSSMLPLSSAQQLIFTSTTSLCPTPGRPVNSARNSR
jgi:hypothetical protein